MYAVAYADVTSFAAFNGSCWATSGVVAPQPLRLFYNSGVRTWDVIVVGGGIIGLSLAIALRKRGASVLVVERGEPGREASHAAGGMLVDSPLETPAELHALAKASAQMYPDFAYELEVESGSKVDLREFGTILLSEGTSELTSASWASSDSADSVAELEPELIGTKNRTAVYLKERSVDPRALVQAAARAAKHRGVDFSTGDLAVKVDVNEGGATGITTTKTYLRANRVVNCAGAWSGQLGPHAFPTRPVKGQMLCLAMPSRSLLKHVIRSPNAYLIPRSDGRLLVGATVEEAGFDKRTDPTTIQRLHRAAVELVPKLAEAKILEDWAGLRPGTPDGLPILGETAIPGYFVATGHFRDGILLAPVTARVMADVVSGIGPEFNLAPFSAARFESASLRR